MLKLGEIDFDLPNQFGPSITYNYLRIDILIGRYILT